MLEKIFGSINSERVLLYLEARNEGYAREIASYYKTSLSPVQQQLDKLESAGVLVSKLSGRTRLYSFNLRYAFIREIRSLLTKAITFLPEEKRKLLTQNRTRPRRKGKPV